MSERRFRVASVLVVVGVLALGLAGVLLWVVPVDAGNLVCGTAAASHPGVVWHHVAEGLSAQEVRENAACDAAGALGWWLGLASAVAGASALAAALVQVLLAGDRGRGLRAKSMITRRGWRGA